MTLKELIIEYKNKTGLNNEAIAKQLGVSKSTVGRWIKGEISNIQTDTMKKLSNLIGTDVLEVLNSNIFTYKKPIMGFVKAGYDLFAEENIEDYIEVNEKDHHNGDYFLRVKGDSMEMAHIYDGDLVYVKQCSNVPSGSIAVILVGNEVTIKKVIIKPNLLILEAANPNIENRYFTPEEVQELPVKIIGQVIYSRTDFI